MLDLIVGLKLGSLQRVKSLVASSVGAVTIAMLSTSLPAVADVSYLIPPDYCGVVVASERSLPLLMASPNLAAYANSQVWVFTTKKGAFAATIGITAKDGREGVLGELLENGVINEDAFCSGGDKFENLTMEPPDAPMPVFGGEMVADTTPSVVPSETAIPKDVSPEEITAAQPIQEGSLRDMIPQVQRLQSVYSDYGRMMDSGNPGSTTGSEMVTPYRCANIGRFLGLSDHLGDGAEFVYLEAGDDPEEFLHEVAALDIWIHTAEEVLSMDGRQMTGLWNLECVGNFGIPISAYVEADTPQAGISAKGDRLTVLGEIDFGFFDRFMIALNQHPEVTTVSLGSGGGSVIDALQAGEVIRQRGLNTELYGKCFSACPMVFVAGVERTIYWPGGGGLGFHKMYTDEGVIPLTDQIYQLLWEYLVEMGIDAETFIGLMTLAGPNEMHEPDVGAMCAPRIATWVQRQCYAE